VNPDSSAATELAQIEGRGEIVKNRLEKAGIPVSVKLAA
jgi:hypothetical protein